MVWTWWLTPAIPAMQEAEVEALKAQCSVGNPVIKGVSRSGPGMRLSGAGLSQLCEPLGLIPSAA